MIREKLPLTIEILTENEEACTDKGAGIFLNKVVATLYQNQQVDFTTFNAESWTRARRKALEINPALDKRTLFTSRIESIVKSEIK